jgi:hypothetical protein
MKTKSNYTATQTAHSTTNSFATPNSIKNHRISHHQQDFNENRTKKTFPSHTEQQNNYHTCYQHIVLKLKPKHYLPYNFHHHCHERSTKDNEMKIMLIFKMKINVKCNPNLEACIICNKEIK